MLQAVSRAAQSRPGLTMSSSATAGVATLQRISAKALSDKMLAEREAADPSFAVVDVRDDGGCFLGALSRHARDCLPRAMTFVLEKPSSSHGLDH